MNFFIFNLFAATLHKGGRSSIRNLRTRHAVVTGTHYTDSKIVILKVFHVFGMIISLLVFFGGGGGIFWKLVPLEGVRKGKVNIFIVKNVQVLSK